MCEKVGGGCKNDMGAGWYTFCVWGAVEVITEVERGVEKDLGGLLPQG